MKDEGYLLKKFDELADFLTECDAVPFDDWTMERFSSFDHAVAQYELLHNILEMSGSPKWCS